MTTNFEHVAYMTNGAELVRTTCGEFANNTALPEIQVVRGSDMWDGEKSLAFGADLTAGKYTPAPTICKAVVQDADGNDVETLLVVDGQQRREAIRRCIAAGKLAPETPIDVILVSDDDADDTFRRLNIGVTVAKSIVGTMDYGQNSRDAVNRLATHSLFGVLGFSAYSRQNGITSAMAQGVAAMVCRYMNKDGNMVPVWDSPSSTYGEAHTALVKHADAIPADEWEKVNALFNDIQTALAPYVEFIGKYGKGKKETATARKLLSSLRKKNLFFTACDAIANGGSPAADVLAALTLTERLEQYGRNGKPYRYTATVNGKSVKLSACWTVGGGSSGSNADFEQRRIILNVVITGMTDVDRKNGLAVAGSTTNLEVKDSTEGAVDAVMAEMGA